MLIFVVLYNCKVFFGGIIWEKIYIPLTYQIKKYYYDRYDLLTDLVCDMRHSVNRLYERCNNETE